MKRPLLACAFLALWTATAEPAGVIRGTIWGSRAEARRAELARQRARDQAPEHRGLFDFLGAGGPKRTPAVPAAAGKRAPSPGTVPAPKRLPEIQDAVISIREIPDKDERRLASQLRRDRRRPLPRIVINRSRYSPRVLSVPAGTDVEIQNLDRIWHSSFSVSSARRFDLGKLKPGAMDTVRLDRPGIINLHCDIHPEESGFVVVTQNHAVARPDSLGRFTLPRLAAGSYRVEIWHPVRGVRERVVEIPPRGDAECDLAF